MKIARIKIKNMFGIREFEAEGKDYELIGENGTGKTSVIDAIRFALNNKSSRDYIVRAGQLEGEIIIETDTGLSINRKARVNKADYKSVQDNGRDVPSPESFLRGIFTELQLNPVEFLSMSKQDTQNILFIIHVWHYLPKLFLNPIQIPLKINHVKNDTVLFLF